MKITRKTVLESSDGHVRFEIHSSGGTYMIVNDGYDEQVTLFFDYADMEDFMALVFKAKTESRNNFVEHEAQEKAEQAKKDNGDA